MLTDPIEAKWFSAIALSDDRETVLARIETAKAAAPRSTGILAGRWTGTTLSAISKNYRLLGHWYSYIYVPRK